MVAMTERIGWSLYVRRIAGGLNQVQIAERAGLSQTNIGKWLRGEPGAPRAESVIAFARAFGQPPLEALIAAGYLSAAEAQVSARTPLDGYTYSELIAELQRRNPDN